MAGWGESWTDNKMFKLQEEKQRQRAVVKMFLANHPEYDSKNDDNNKALVDVIEASKRPFTNETIEWAYESIKVCKNIYKNVSTALTNSTTSIAPPPQPKYSTEPLGYMSVNMYGKPVSIPYYDLADVESIKTVEKIIEGFKEVEVDKEPAVQYDKDIKPTTTARRIKDDDD